MKRKILTFAPCFGVMATVLFGTSFFIAEGSEIQGLTDQEILIGMSTALTGPTQTLGIQMKAGVEAAFKIANDGGGIFGRKVGLKAYDDGYESLRTGVQMRKLVTEDKVFAFLGNVGTPTTVVALPIANENKIPFFGAFTGTGILRKTPPDKYVFNFRASYAEETREMIIGLVKELKIKPQEIGFFTQNDAYGDGGYKGAQKALQDLGFADGAKLVHGRYRRNTENVEDGLSRILEAPVKVKAVIMVGTYKPCAKFIKLARKEGFHPIFVNVSFVGSASLQKELGQLSEGVIVTQVVPSLEAKLPLVQEYRQAIAPGHKGFVSLEGFVAARAFLTGLKGAGKDLTREKFVETLENFKDIDLGLNEKYSLSSQNHQFSHKVFPTIIRDGKFESFDWKDLATTDLVGKGSPK